MEYLGWVLVLLGCILNLISAFGCLKLPDFFPMIQAAGVGDSCGTPLVLFGLIFVVGISMLSFKILVLIGLVLLLSPTATHALARASLDDDKKT